VWQTLMGLDNRDVALASDAEIDLWNNGLSQRFLSLSLSLSLYNVLSRSRSLYNVLSRSGSLALSRSRFRYLSRSHWSWPVSPRE